MANKRLFDANALLKRLEECTDEKDWIVSQYNADWIWSMIDSAPTEDAKETIHGLWVRYEHGSGIFCSHCRHKRRYRDENDKYCPNCGAKMDGEKNENKRY